MIVYGDPQYTISRAAAREKLLSYFARAADRSLDSARDLAIALGQLEQAISDDPVASAESVRGIMTATDCAAEQLVSIFLNKSPAPGILEESRLSLMQALESTASLESLRIKIPEGFAFYSLLPEQYIAATETFTNRRDAARTLVVGIRTIGTGLSAIVKAALAARGFPATRITLRPNGHPFARSTELPDLPLASAIIIVDEGPGLSGSSMASVASAFRERGATDITFFPSHGNAPGTAASEKTRQIWAETPRIVQPVLVGNVNSNPLISNFRSQTEQIIQSSATLVHDLSAGGWTKHVQANEPIYTTPSFERSKFLVQTESTRSVLWKFAGVGPGCRLESLRETAVARQRKLAAVGFCQTPLGACSGFVATEWLQGPLASSRDLTPAPLQHLANYIVAAANPPLDTAEAAAGRERLKEMTRFNLQASRSQDLLQVFEQFSPPVDQLVSCPAYGDGRLAPHEWLFSRNRLIKTDVWGHDFDHTIVGPQPIYWDIAGAIFEWNIAAPVHFLDSFQPTCRIAPSILVFYLCAYGAFRLGILTLAGHREAASSTLQHLPSLCRQLAAL